MGGEQLVLVRRVDAVEVGVRERRARDPHMHLARACLAHHLHDLHRSRAAHHAVVDQHDALALDLAFIGAVLQLYAELPDALLGLDKGSADIVIADDAVFERQPRLLRIADGRGHARVRNGDDDVCIGRSLARQLPAHLFPYFIDRAATDDRVRPGEIDVFEDAEPRRVFGNETVALDALARDHYHLAILDLAHEFRADDVERAGLRGKHPRFAELAQHERPDAVRIARADIIGAEF